jgi:hypothetical protein
MTHKPPQGIDARRKAKFRIGQVVRVMGSVTFQTFLPSYFRISGVKPYGHSWQYRITDHETLSPWVAGKQLRPLTKREAGR